MKKNDAMLSVLVACLLLTLVGLLGWVLLCHLAIHSLSDQRNDLKKRVADLKQVYDLDERTIVNLQNSVSQLVKELEEQQAAIDSSLQRDDEDPEERVGKILTTPQR